MEITSRRSNDRLNARERNLSGAGTGTRSALDLEGLAALLRRDARRRVLLRLRLELALRELRPHLRRGGRVEARQQCSDGLASPTGAQGRSAGRRASVVTPGRGHRAAARRAPSPGGWRSRSSSGRRPCAPPPSSSPPALARRASAPPERGRRIAAVVRHRPAGRCSVLPCVAMAWAHLLGRRGARGSRLSGATSSAPPS